MIKCMVLTQMNFKHIHTYTYADNFYMEDYGFPALMAAELAHFISPYFSVHTTYIKQAPYLPLAFIVVDIHKKNTCTNSP